MKVLDGNMFIISLPQFVQFNKFLKFRIRITYGMVISVEEAVHSLRDSVVTEFFNSVIDQFLLRLKKQKKKTFLEVGSIPTVISVILSKRFFLCIDE